MTKLATRKTRLSFETEATVRYRGQDRPVLVECDSTGHHAGLRLKGTRVRYEVSWRGVYDFAAKVKAERDRAERKAKKKARRA